MAVRRGIRQGGADGGNGAWDRAWVSPLRRQDRNTRKYWTRKSQKESTLAESKRDNFWKVNTEDEIIPYKACEGTLWLSEMQIKMAMCFL